MKYLINGICRTQISVDMESEEERKILGGLLISDVNIWIKSFDTNGAQRIRGFVDESYWHPKNKSVFGLKV
jgi:hypothetical protein